MTKTNVIVMMKLLISNQILLLLKSPPLDVATDKNKSERDKKANISNSQREPTVLKLSV